MVTVSMAYSSQPCQGLSFAARNKGRVLTSSLLGMHKRESSSAVLIANLRALMAARGWKSNRELAKASKVSDRMIGKVLNGESVPTTDTMDKLGAAFGVAAWQLMIPGVADLLGRDSRMEELFDAYLRADNEGRRVMENTADYVARRQEAPANDPSRPEKKKGNGPSP